MKPKLRDILVVSDMDGTLLNSQLQIAGADLETIRLFTRLGGNFTIATGRMAESPGRYGELCPLLSPAITTGGAMIYDYSQGEVLESFTLNYEVASRVMLDVAQAFPHVGIMVAAGDGRAFQVASSNALMTLFTEEHMTYYMRPTEEIPQQWNKLLFASEPDVLAAVEAFARAQYYPGVEFVRTSPMYFELMPQGVNKGTALQRLCELMGLSIENSFAIGNYYNDIDLLQAAGHAVAVANSPPELMRIAHRVTACNDEAGVGQLLYWIIEEYGAN